MQLKAVAAWVVDDSLFAIGPSCVRTHVCIPSMLLLSQHLVNASADAIAMCKPTE